jgi:hypothetical protein
VKRRSILYFERLTVLGILHRLDKQPMVVVALKILRLLPGVLAVVLPVATVPGD